MRISDWSSDVCSSDLENNGSIQNQASVNALRDNDMETPLNPPAPGEPGGLADDKTPVSEAPFTETSAQGAANVVQIYYALLEAKKYEPAWKVWQDEGRARGMTFDEFKESFSKYQEYQENIHAPGRNKKTKELSEGKKD